MLSAHDCWREGKKLRTSALNLGFPASDEEDEGNTSQIRDQPVGTDNRHLDLGFPLSDEEYDIDNGNVSDMLTEIRRPPVAENNRSLHLGFPLSDEDTSDIDIQHQPVGKDN